MGNTISCPDGHTLVSVDFDIFATDWTCDRCKKFFSSNDERWRCCSKCDIDHCEPCIKAVDYKPDHSHTLASINYKCIECGEIAFGNRVHCPDCKTTYDACYICALLKIRARGTSCGGPVKSIVVTPNMLAPDATRDVFKVDVPMQDGAEQAYILKAFKPMSFNAEMNVDIVMKVYLKTHQLALQFNQEVPLNHPIIFKQPIIHSISSTVENDGRRVFAVGEKVALEPFLEGNFQKFVSNSGYILDGYTAPEVFTHYTWHKTRELIVCDLQGVRQIEGKKDDGYYFTDPAIDSLKQDWGPTDMGKQGILNFFSIHKCSKFCNKWDKPPAEDQTALLPVVQRTSYADSNAIGSAKFQPGMDTELAQLFSQLLSGMFFTDEPQQIN